MTDEKRQEEEERERIKDEKSKKLLALYVRGSKEGEPPTREADDAFRALYNLQNESLRGFIQVKLGGARPFIMQGGNAICLESWGRIARSAKLFKGQSKFFTWACAIATNAFYDYVREHHWDKEKQAPFDQEGEQPAIDGAPARDASVTASVERNEATRDIEAAVMELDEKHRTIVLLRLKEQLEWHEIEELTGIPPGTGHARLKAALKLLGPVLRKHLDQKTSGGRQ